VNELFNLIGFGGNQKDQVTRILFPRLGTTYKKPQPSFKQELGLFNG
jgi:hypothetical protein